MTVSLARIGIVAVLLGTMTTVRAALVDSAVVQLQCPVNQQIAQSAEEITVTGCRSIVSFPDTRSDDFTPCCNVVTACYQICGVPKEDCDKLARNCAKGLCAVSLEPPRFRNCDAGQKALLRSPLLRRDAYEAAQNRSCECVHDANVIGRYVQHARSVLERARTTNAKERLNTLQRAMLGVEPSFAAKRGMRELVDVVKSNTKGLSDDGAAEARKEQKDKKKRKNRAEDDEAL
jgi:hypothetical protein